MLLSLTLLSVIMKAIKNMQTESISHCIQQQQPATNKTKQKTKNTDRVEGVRDIMHKALTN